MLLAGLLYRRGIASGLPYRVVYRLWCIILCILLKGCQMTDEYITNDRNFISVIRSLCLWPALSGDKWMINYNMKTNIRLSRGGIHLYRSGETDTCIIINVISARITSALVLLWYTNWHFFVFKGYFIVYISLFLNKTIKLFVSSLVRDIK